jgi:RNA polymerase sigma factor (sigma-70 family)
MREIPYGLDLEPVYEQQQLALGRTLTLEAVEFQHDFDRALRALPAPERDAFILTQLRGLTVRDAADELDVSYRTVARRAEAARTLIREEIA